MKSENNLPAGEARFLVLLEQKAREQRRLVETEIIPSWAKGVGDWLVVHPWRVLIPLAGMLYIILRIFVGVGVRELMLGLFGGY